MFDRKSFSWRSLALLAIAAIAMFGLSLPAGAQPVASTSDAPMAISSLQDKVVVGAKRAWTRAEMLAAVPMDEAVPLKATSAADQASAAAAIAGVEANAASAGGSVAGGAPENVQNVPLLDAAAPPAASDQSLAAERAALSALGMQPAGAQGAAPRDSSPQLVAPQAVAGPQPYPSAYTRFEVFSGRTHPYTYAIYPYSTLGKLFFRQRDFRDGITKSWVCSASVVANGAIMTAAQCLHAGRFTSSGWSTNAVFVPAYKDGYAPLGQWTPRFLRVFTAWYSGRNFARDVGGALMNRDIQGRTVSQVTGWLGIAWNWSYNQHYNAFGYPVALPFNGLRLQTCEGSLAYYDTAYVPATKAIGCDMNGGSSGGAWIKGFGTGNWLNGVNSYKRVANGVVLSQEMFSPHFDGYVKSVIWDCVVLNVGC